MINEHFADLFNTIIFRGEQVIKLEDLKEEYVGKIQEGKNTSCVFPSKVL